jgi:hypothetical protein
MRSRQTFEGKFGDCSIVTTRVRVTASPTEENTFHVILFDVECDIKNFFLHTSPIPKGEASVKWYAKVPPKCPNCGHELYNMGLDHYELKESDSYNYKGVTAEVIQSYEEDILELKLHYEVMEYVTQGQAIG